MGGVCLFSILDHLLSIPGQHSVLSRASAVLVCSFLLVLTCAAPTRRRWVCPLGCGAWGPGTAPRCSDQTGVRTQEGRHSPGIRDINRGKSRTKFEARALHHSVSPPRELRVERCKPESDQKFLAGHQPRSRQGRRDKVPLEVLLLCWLQGEGDVQVQPWMDAVRALA